MNSTIRTIVLAFILTLVSFAGNAQTQEVAAPEVDTTKAVFEKVEVEASFPGGEQAWRRFLERNLNGSVPVDNGAPCGVYTVFVQFIVNKQGGISGAKALTKLGYGMEKEVLRIINKSGLWTPAIQKGQNVNAYRKQPVTFMVQDDAFTIFTRTPYVLYTGEDNVLRIEAGKLKTSDLELEITEGSIALNEDGQFVALVKKPGRVVITLYNKKKRSKPIGAMSFEVRDPNAPKAPGSI